MAQRLAAGRAGVKYQSLWGQRTAKIFIKKEIMLRQMRSVSACANIISSGRLSRICRGRSNSVNSSISGSSVSSLGRTKRYVSSSANVGEILEAENGCPDWQNPEHLENPENSEMVPLPPLDDGSSKVLASPHLKELADRIVRLNMLEVKELVDRLGEHFGIEDHEMSFVAGGGAGEAEASNEEAEEEERTAFDLKLTGFDAKSKIKVIKEVRAITSLGLKDAKALVEGVPATVKNDIKMEEAEELKAKLEAVGATVEIS